MDQKKQVNWALVIVLLVAAILRFYSLNWDEGQHTHPDERWIAMVAPAIRLPATVPARLVDMLDPRRSTLNPLWTPDGQDGGQLRNFAYGHLPLYLHAFAGQAMSALGRQMLEWGESYHETAYTMQSLGEYGGITLVGRVLSALCDLGTIYLVFLLGRRIYNDQIGLLAAALVAFAVMHIQLSHFSTFDVMTTFFIILSLYGSVCVVRAEPKQWWPTVWSGLAAGLAVASKFSAAPLLAVLAVAQVIRFARAGDGKLLRRALPNIALSLSCALLAFAITSPFAILDYKLYIKQIVEQSTMVRGAADWPFTRQYRNTTPFVYSIVEQVRWGLGWPLGIFAFAGFGWTLLRAARPQRRALLAPPYDAELILLCWAVPYFLLTSSFMVKFMRYMLPLLPLFILMGAAMVVQIAKWANEQMTKQQIANGQNMQYAISLALAYLPHVLLISTLVWALAFTWIYAQEHPWIQASKWIYQNVPDGSIIAVEHWDDHLPLSLPLEGANPGVRGYQHVELPMYEDDNYTKYDTLRTRLHEADYIVLSTNRLYRTIPRLPDRYPISSEFYRLLFAGELGFERVAEFTAYPSLFGLNIVDDDADESFTVYDHPKPIVFKKIRRLDYAAWDRLFRDVLSRLAVWNWDKKFDLLALLDSKPAQEGEVEKTLLLDEPVGALPVVADWGWNKWASGSTVWSALLATLLWWLAVALIGALAFPLIFVVFSGLRDRGYMLARSIGLLLVGYLIWLPSSLRWFPNGLPLTLAAMLVVAGASALLLRRYGAELKAWVREHWRVILLGEAVFGLALLFFVGIRMLNPDLWHPWNGGEKGMDLAYLNACMRSAYFPPYDPYFSDGYLNYYYYGQFLVSIVARLTGISASVAFNLAVPLYFALTVSTVFCIGYSLARNLVSPRNQVSARIACGLLAVLFMALLGNLDSVIHIVEQLGTVSQSAFASRLPGVQMLVRAADGLWRIVAQGARFPGFNYWDRSRVVGLTINEFPYWSFLFADLHPHMMNIPFTALVIAFALNWWLRQREPVRTDLPDFGNLGLKSEWALVKNSFRCLWQRLGWGEVLVWPLWALALGALAAINTWDFPAFAGLSGLALLLAWTRARGKQGVGPALMTGIGLAAGGLLLYMPFFKYYTALFVGVDWGLGRAPTEPGEFLTVWGLML
ncbi:MAG: glycosyltransferase family 39 protein, partial [Anaerolineae bacterium]|nr:glycosyltransferase family 39 protein [Anaerolineae bacterium]